MGYYSKVAIALWKPDYEELLKKADGELKNGRDDIFSLFPERGEFSTPDETYVCLYNPDTKWYENDQECFPSVDFVEKFIREVRHAKVRIGEEVEDIEVETSVSDEYGTDEEFYNLISAETVVSGLTDLFGISQNMPVKKAYIVTTLEPSQNLSLLLSGMSSEAKVDTKAFADVDSAIDYAYTRYIEYFNAIGGAMSKESLKQALLDDRAIRVEGKDSHLYQIQMAVQRI